MSPISTTPLNETVSKEIANFQEKSKQYRAGEVPDEQFRPFRLLHGIYGQRQENVQMIRIKIPGGQVSSNQLRRLGEIARDWAPLGIGHVTTRQCVQVHFIKLENVPTIMEKLAEVGITTREACGNAIRNITCSPVAGLDGEEVFDPFPYAEAAFRYFVRRPEFSNLPRKFKMSFNGSRKDWSQAAINDVGFIAQTRITGGKVERGFKIKVGGGLGASPQDAWLYDAFVPENEVLPLVESILVHFNEKGERKNRMAARIKFLIRKEGFDTFKAEVEKIRATKPREIPFPLEAQPAEPQGDPSAKAPAEGPKQYKEWLRLNTWPQKQKGFRYAIVKLVLGDMTHGQFFRLAEIAEKFGNASVRFSNDQNLLIPFVAENKLADLYAALDQAGLSDLGPDLVGDVTSCPGADTCNLGLVSSRGLGAKLTEVMAYGKEENKDLEGAHIKISGCPNSCGQHHVATFGFFGNVRNIAGQNSPHFQMMLGGGIGEEGATFGRAIGRVPARRAPLAVKAFIEKFRKERQGAENLEGFLRRLPLDEAKKVLEPFTEIASGDPELFKDNGSEEQFIFDGLGASECA